MTEIRRLLGVLLQFRLVMFFLMSMAMGCMCLLLMQSWGPWAWGLVRLDVVRRLGSVGCLLFVGWLCVFH